jgi:hypothetical protein
MQYCILVLENLAYCNIKSFCKQDFTDINLILLNMQREMCKVTITVQKSETYNVIKL